MKAAFLALALAATGLSAQTLKEIKLDTATVQVGQNVTASVGLDASDQANCGMRVIWGDGAITQIRVEDKSAIPYKATHAYTKAGDFQIVADPQKVKSSLPCVGKKVSAVVKVVAPPAPPPPAPVAAAPAAPASIAKAPVGPTCPEGWNLNTKSVKKSGVYSCVAKAGTPAPEKKPACPGDLTYFENSKKGVLGCQV